MEPDQPENEHPLADEAFVIRLGLMRLDDVRVSVQQCRTSRGFYGLSFYGENSLVPEDVAVYAEKPHLQMRRSRVGTIRKAGFEIQRSGRFPHLSVVFQVEPADEQLERLIAAFDEPEPNPHPVK